MLLVVEKIAVGKPQLGKRGREGGKGKANQALKGLVLLIKSLVHGVRTVALGAMGKRGGATRDKKEGRLP